MENDQNIPVKSDKPIIEYDYNIQEAIKKQKKPVNLKGMNVIFMSPRKNLTHKDIISNLDNEYVQKYEFLQPKLIGF